MMVTGYNTSTNSPTASVKGDTLIRKVLDDASIGLSLLEALPQVNRQRLGVLGHSYGGNTVLFHAALDERISIACSSGAACSYRRKMADGIPFEFALTIPGFCELADIGDLVSAIAPREILIVSADDDKYSKDADTVSASARSIFEKLKVPGALQHKRYAGGHALTQERFDFVVNWVTSHK